MTTPPMPETIEKWRAICAGRHLNELQHSLCGALAEAATACEALIAERDRLGAEALALDRRKHELEAERDQALARVKVAADALLDVCDYHAGERSCRSTYSEPDTGPCDCHVDTARAALAEIGIVKLEFSGDHTPGAADAQVEYK